MITENGWPSCDSSDLDYSSIPGSGSTIGLQKGLPSRILKAFAADINWYVESLNNSRGSSDEGGWTPTNSVPTSNHLGGTAMDLNWSDHPMGPKVPDPAAGWQWSEIVGGPEEPRVRELLAYYTYKGVQMVWWGNDWTSPNDSMHFQMGYNTYGNPLTQEFADNFIKDDGFSRFKDSKAGDPTAHTPSNADATAILTQIMGGASSVDYSQYTAAAVQSLKDCECNTLQRIAMWAAQIGTESAGLRYMEEIADGSEYEGRADLGNTQPGDGTRFKGRGPIQVTGRSNYTRLSSWAYGKGLVPTATYFVDNPTELASATYGFVGVTWYWTTTVRSSLAETTLNAAADAGDVYTATLIVNGGTHGLPDRTDRYNRIIAAGDQVLDILNGDSSTGTDNQGDDFMADPDIVNKINEIWACLLGNNVQSQSRYIADGEGPKWKIHELIKNDDGMTHENYIERLAVLGDPDAVALVYRNATRNDTIAQSVLIRIDDKFLDAEQQYLKQLVITNRFPSPVGHATSVAATSGVATAVTSSPSATSAGLESSGGNGNDEEL